MYFICELSINLQYNVYLTALSSSLALVEYECLVGIVGSRMTPHT